MGMPQARIYIFLNLGFEQVASSHFFLLFPSLSFLLEANFNLKFFCSQAIFAVVPESYLRSALEVPLIADWE